MLVKFLIICVLAFGSVESRPQENPCAGIIDWFIPIRNATKNILDLRNQDTL